LAVLRAHPRWKDLQNLLERRAQEEYNRLADGLPYEEYLAQVGCYQAYRQVVDLVDTILSHVKDNDERESAAREHARDHTQSVFYASPYK